MKLKKSFALILAVILIIFVTTAVLGLSFFVIENTRLLIAREGRLKSLYLAEAGVQEAVYWYRENFLNQGSGYFSLGQYPLGLTESFTLSGDEAGLLVVDSTASAASNGKNRYEVGNIYLHSAVDSQALTVTDIVITWTDAGSNLKKVMVGASNAWSGNSSSPAALNISDKTVSTGPENLVMEFSYGDPTAQSIVVRFIMQDSTYKEVAVYPAYSSGNITFRSEGAVETGAALIQAVLEAEYNIADSKIVRYRKIQ